MCDLCVGASLAMFKCSLLNLIQSEGYFMYISASDEGMDNDGDHIVIPSQDNMQENRPRQRLTSSLSKVQCNMNELNK